MRKKDADKDPLSPFWQPPRTRAQKITDNRKIVRQMAFEGATQEDIAQELGCHKTNISLVYRKDYDEGRRGIGMSVRQWQILKARKGCTEMLKHVGRLYCKDQKDVGVEELSAGSLKSSVDAICQASEKNNQENACGNSAQNKSTSSKTQPIDTISPLDQSDQGKA